MKREDIHIGDVVRIRQYEDMAREFGETKICNTRWVKTTRTFLYIMRYLCGRTFTVSELSPLGEIRSDEDNFDGFLITVDMVEPVEQIEYEYIDISTFLGR